jgi:ribosome maturation factor RimP
VSDDHAEPDDEMQAAPAGTEADHSARFLVESGLAAQFAAIVEPTIVDLGYRLVRILVSGKEGKTVQIMAERPDGSMTIDDCETVSKSISPVLDVHDPLAGAYRLEVSSPGIERPLVRPSDFEDWAGYEARVELKQPVDGRRKFKGMLDGFEDGEVRMECDIAGAGLKVLGFPVHLVSDAKLVITDELIRESLNRAKKSKTGRPGDGIELDETDIEIDAQLDAHADPKIDPKIKD